MRRGFSLIELLVVISIITLLIAILLPALGAARDSARNMQCLSNTRQHATGALNHATDRKDQLPVAGLIRNLGLPSDQYEQTLRRAADRSQTFTTAGGADLPTPWTVSIADYLGVKMRTDTQANMVADMDDAALAKFYTCPSDEEVASVGQLHYVSPLGAGTGTGGTISGLSSYGFNEAALGFSGTGDRVFGDLSKVLHPSRVMHTADAEPVQITGGWAMFWNQTNSSDLYNAWTSAGAGDRRAFCDLQPDRNNVRHGRGTMNAAMLDGHVETVLIGEPDAMRDIWISKGLGREP